MTEELLPKTEEGKYWKLAEECGEVVQMLSKIHRFGIDNKKKGSKVTNREKLQSEIVDLKDAIKKVEVILKKKED